MTPPMMTCTRCDGDGFEPNYVDSCRRCKGSGKEVDHRAVAVRRLHFCAGPESTDFYACSEHRELLDHNGMDAAVLCFFGSPKDDVRPVDPDDEIPCHFCREE